MGVVVVACLARGGAGFAVGPPGLRPGPRPVLAACAAQRARPLRAAGRGAQAGMETGEWAASRARCAMCGGARPVPRMR